MSLASGNESASRLHPSHSFDTFTTSQSDMSDPDKLFVPAVAVQRYSVDHVPSDTGEDERQSYLTN